MRKDESLNSLRSLVFFVSNYAESKLSLHWKQKSLLHPQKAFVFVGMTGFEPATPSSRTKYATGLRYIPNEFYHFPRILPAKITQLRIFLNVIVLFF